MRNRVLFAPPALLRLPGFRATRLQKHSKAPILETLGDLAILVIHWGLLVWGLEQGSAAVSPLRQDASVSLIERALEGTRAF